MHLVKSEFDFQKFSNSNGRSIYSFSKLNKYNNKYIHTKGISKNGKTLIEQTVKNRNKPPKTMQYLMTDEEAVKFFLNSNKFGENFNANANEGCLICPAKPHTEPMLMKKSKKIKKPKKKSKKKSEKYKKKSGKRSKKKSEKRSKKKSKKSKKKSGKRSKKKSGKKS